MNGTESHSTKQPPPQVTITEDEEMELAVTLAEGEAQTASHGESSKDRASPIPSQAFTGEDKSVDEAAEATDLQSTYSQHRHTIEPAESNILITVINSGTHEPSEKETSESISVTPIASLSAGIDSEQKEQPGC
jgi:hypothetical protein